jgi:hypothetical protein
MMSDYTPTTDDVRHYYHNGVEDHEGRYFGEAEFNRWLAKVEQEAFRKGADCIKTGEKE